VLGGLPEASQPSQKAFETRLWHALRKLDPRRPVYVESESRKIGDLRVPEPLVARMWAAPCVVLEAETPLRVALLMEEYAHFLTDRAALADRLSALVALHGRARIAHWLDLADANRHEELVAELLDQHYDPAYRRSIGGHYATLATAPLLAVSVSDGAAAYDRLAARLAHEEQVAA
jgi:tRNA 2-selenouridine synthase